MLLGMFPNNRYIYLADISFYSFQSSIFPYLSYFSVHEIKQGKVNQA